MRRFAVAVGLVAATWHGAACAQAAPESPAGVQIAWQGPADCDRGDAVRAKVARLLGGSAHSGAGIKVFVTVQHEKSGRYVAVLETASTAGGGKKRLEGESCDAIALASSVVIALSLDPNASLDAEAPEDAAPQPAPKPKPTPPPMPAPPARPTPPPREVKPYLHASVGVLLQLLDGPVAATGAGVGVRYRRFGLELGGAVYQSRDVTRSDRPKVGAELRGASGELLGCYAVLPFQLGAVDACPGARLDYLSATAFGVSNPDRAQVLVLSGLGVLRGRLRATSWLSATLDVGAALHPFRPRFVLLGVGDVYETPMFSSFARTGLRAEF